MTPQLQEPLEQRQQNTPEYPLEHPLTLLPSNRQSGCSLDVLSWWLNRRRRNQQNVSCVKQHRKSSTETMCFCGCWPCSSVTFQMKKNPVILPTSNVFISHWNNGILQCGLTWWQYMIEWVPTTEEQQRFTFSVENEGQQKFHQEDRLMSIAFLCILSRSLSSPSGEQSVLSSVKPPREKLSFTCCLLWDWLCPPLPVFIWNSSHELSQVPSHHIHPYVRLGYSACSTTTVQTLPGLIVKDCSCISLVFPLVYTMSNTPGTLPSLLSFELKALIDQKTEALSYIVFSSMLAVEHQQKEFCCPAD